MCVCFFFNSVLICSTKTFLFTCWYNKIYGEEMISISERLQLPSLHRHAVFFFSLIFLFLVNSSWVIKYVTSFSGSSAVGAWWRLKETEIVGEALSSHPSWFYWVHCFLLRKFSRGGLVETKGDWDCLRSLVFLPWLFYVFCITDFWIIRSRGRAEHWGLIKCI